MHPLSEEPHPEPRENKRRTSRFTTLRETLLPWIIPAAAAAVLTLATAILFWMPGETAPSPAAKVTSTSPPPPAATPVTAPRGDTTTGPLYLPLQANQPRLAEIITSIRNQRALPSRSSVRPAEILGSFSFRLTGTTAIARPAAKPDAAITPPLATLATEMLPCPWKPSSTLLLISLRGNLRQDCQVTLAYHPQPQNVAQAQLLGFPSTTPNPATRLPTKLVVGAVTTLAIEIATTTTSTDLGSLIWSIDGTAAPEIRLTRQPDAAPSDDARFAALVCTYSQWLAGGQAGVIRPEMISALTREITTATLPADRADFLRLITESLLL
jgi:hypothetical protein